MNTCFGKHVEPCQRYHQQLHFIQKSHECFGCATADEMHIKRHREIAHIVQSIRKYDDENTLSMHGSSRRKSNECKAVANSDLDGVSDSLSQLSTTEQKPLTRKQRKDAKKLTKKAIKLKTDSTNITKDEVDFISEAIHQKIVTGKGSNFIEDGHSPDADGEMKGVTPEILENNIAFNKFQRNKFYGKRNRTIEEARIYGLRDSTVCKRALSKTECVMPKKEIKVNLGPVKSLDISIFDRLGIPIHVGHDNSRKRKDLIKKLAVDIQADLDVIEREESETRIREAGFWRFVNRHTLENMRDLHEGFSWSTGELVKQKKLQKSSEKNRDKENVQVPAAKVRKNVQSMSKLPPLQVQAKNMRYQASYMPEYTYPQPKKPQKLDLNRMDNRYSTPRSIPDYDTSLSDLMFWEAEPPSPSPITISPQLAVPCPLESIEEQSRKSLRIINTNFTEPPLSPGWTRVINTRSGKKRNL